MKQRGALSADLSAYLMAIVLLLVVITPPIHAAAFRYLTQHRIQADIETIAFHSRDHYALSVLRTRCLAQSNISMAALGINAERAGVRYEVSYRQSLVPNARPSGLTITVSLTDDTLRPLAARLSADEVRGHTLTFYRPLNVQLPDWQQLNTQTGCLK